MGVTLDDMLDVDYNKPLEGIHDRARFTAVAPRKAIAAGAISFLFTNAVLTGVTLYYRLSKDGWDGSYPFWKNIIENGSTGFLAGFTAGLVHDYKKRERLGKNFGFAEIAAAAAGGLFFIPMRIYAIEPIIRSYRSYGLQKDLVENAANATLAVSSYLFAVSLYTACAVFNFKNCEVVSCAGFSRFNEFFGKYNEAVGFQKELAGMPSRYAAKNFLRLGNLYLKAGNYSGAAESFASVFQDEPAGGISSDILNFPLSAMDAVYSRLVSCNEMVVRFFYRLFHDYEESVKERIAGKLGIAASHFSKGQYKRTDTALREAIMLDTAEPLPHHIYSMFLLKCGMEEETAREQIIVSLLADPEHARKIYGTRNDVYEQAIEL